MSHGHSNATFNIPIDEFFEDYTCVDPVKDHYLHRKSNNTVVVVFETIDYMVVRYL